MGRDRADVLHDVLGPAVAGQAGLLGHQHGPGGGDYEGKNSRVRIHHASREESVCVVRDPVRSTPSRKSEVQTSSADRQLGQCETD